MIVPLFLIGTLTAAPLLAESARVDGAVLTLEFRRRYWTLLIDGRAAFTFPTLKYAMESVPEATVVVGVDL